MTGTTTTLDLLAFSRLRAEEDEGHIAYRKASRTGATFLTGTRIAVLWNELPSYLTSCLEALQSRYKVELLIVRMASDRLPPAEQHAYDESIFSSLQRKLVWEELGSTELQRQGKLQAILEDYRPRFVLAGNWVHSPYLPLLPRLRKGGSIVIGCMDNQWRNTHRQWLMSLLARGWLRSRFDYLWVPGERQGQYARRLGFDNDRQLHGLYVCDFELFNAAARRRSAEPSNDSEWPRQILFVGRFVEQKGIADLVKAYRMYRSRVAVPWALHCIGGGPLEDLLRHEDGIVVESFCQPAELATAFEHAGIFVLPSRYEPWGVVIHEATAAGLPVICSSECGSSVELVQDGYNGFVFSSGDILDLAHLLEYSTSGAPDLRLMGCRSAEMAKRYSPEQWADYLAERLNRSIEKTPSIASNSRI